MSSSFPAAPVRPCSALRASVISVFILATASSVVDVHGAKTAVWATVWGATGRGGLTGGLGVCGVATMTKRYPAGGWTPAGHVPRFVLPRPAYRYLAQTTLSSRYCRIVRSMMTCSTALGIFCRSLYISHGPPPSQLAVYRFPSLSRTVNAIIPLVGPDTAVTFHSSVTADFRQPAIELQRGTAHRYLIGRIGILHDPGVILPGIIAGRLQLSECLLLSSAVVLVGNRHRVPEDDRRDSTAGYRRRPDVRPAVQLAAQRDAGGGLAGRPGVGVLGRGGQAMGP